MRTRRTRSPSRPSPLVQPSDPASLRSRSPLEERLLALCRDAGIELPELNAPFTLPDGTPIEIDALWRRQRLAVETDSPTYHSAWPMQVSDRHRDQQLTLAGYKPLRLVDEDLEEREGATTALLRQLRGSPTPGRDRLAGQPVRYAGPAGSER